MACIWEKLYYCIDFFIKQLEILKIDMSGLIEREKAICGRLHGSTNQLKDIEDEKADEIRQDFLAIEKDITEENENINSTNH